MFSSQRLRALRKEKKMSLEKLGSLLNVSRVAVSNWETGRSTPTESNLKQLASVMGVSEDYFIENSEITSIFVSSTKLTKIKLLLYLLNYWLSSQALQMAIHLNYTATRDLWGPFSWNRLLLLWRWKLHPHLLHWKHPPRFCLLGCW